MSWWCVFFYFFFVYDVSIYLHNIYILLGSFMLDWHVHNMCVCVLRCFMCRAWCFWDVVFPASYSLCSAWYLSRIYYETFSVILEFGTYFGVQTPWVLCFKLVIIGFLRFFAILSEQNLNRRYERHWSLNMGAFFRLKLWMQAPQSTHWMYPAETG